MINKEEGKNRYPVLTIYRYIIKGWMIVRIEARPDRLDLGQ